MVSEDGVEVSTMHGSAPFIDQEADRCRLRCGLPWFGV
jgi:hypothetical protein